MTTEKFVQNLKKILDERGISYTQAGRESGAGVDFIRNIERRGSAPSFTRVQQMAQYLGMTTSELLGEEKASRPQFEDGQMEELAQIFEQMNEEGRAKILSYAEDLASSGNYKKVGSFGLGKTELA